MSVWKLQCHFCSDTVSTVKLNQQYYQLHLEAVHNVQQKVDSLLQWTLAEQGVGESGGSVVAKKGINIQRIINVGLSAPKTPVAAPLLNMKGITVERVDKQGVQHNTINLAQQQQERAGARLGHQERAINKWANGCEHGCRICRKLGETFTSFTRQGLLKHLKIEHEVSEQGYKEEFQCLNLITRISITSCKECGTRIKRSPANLTTHLRKHELNIKSYWLKHLKQQSMPISPSPSQGSSLACWQSRSQLPSVGLTRRALSDQGVHKCNTANCGKTFGSEISLRQHKSWHGRVRKGDSSRRGMKGTQPVVIGERRENEINPMDMLEVEIGDNDEEFEKNGDNAAGEDAVPSRTEPIEITSHTGVDEPMCSVMAVTSEEINNGRSNASEPGDVI